MKFKNNFLIGSLLILFLISTVNAHANLELSPTTVWFNISNMLPGDSVSKTVILSNTGDRQINNIVLYAEFINYCTGIEPNDYCNTNPNLTDVLILNLNGINSRITNLENGINLGLSLNSGQSKTLNLKILFDPDAENEYQATSAEITFLFVATETEEEPSPRRRRRDTSGGGIPIVSSKPKPSCFDGIRNCPDGLCEEGIDCGGSCKPCLTCYDGIQNQGETGIDCGGPCEPCEPIIEPQYIRKCSAGYVWLYNVETGEYHEIIEKCKFGCNRSTGWCITLMPSTTTTTTTTTIPTTTTTIPEEIPDYMSFILIILLLILLLILILLHGTRKGDKKKDDKKSLQNST